MAGGFLPWVRTCDTAVRTLQAAGTGPRSAETLDGSWQGHHNQAEGKAWPPGALVLGFPWPLAKDKPKPSLCAKKWPLRSVSPALGRNVCSQVCAWNFYPSNTAGQDLVRKFSRGNAFNKNLMGSGSSAESPYEFQVFVWSLACAGALPQATNGLVSRVGTETLEQAPAAPAPCSPGEGRACFSRTRSGEPLGEAPGSSGNRHTEGTWDTQWESNAYEDLKSVKEQRIYCGWRGSVIHFHLLSSDISRGSALRRRLSGLKSSPRSASGAAGHR